MLKYIKIDQKVELNTEM